uniref:DUF4209 domain-containing protein n=1 Tax=Chitinilyticum litopenaei TaxID=1121276 RepID=UPI0011854861|nr:DUF4209 domain-containing protein [Chitinilyticum litopenaei]
MTNPILKARLADLVWIRADKRNVTAALAAMDSYRQIPLDKETWIRYGRECWERAIELAKWLKRTAKPALDEMEIKIFSAFQKSTMDDGFFAFWLGELMLVNRLCTDKREVIAERLAFLGDEFRNCGDIHRARSFFKLATEYFERLNDIQAAACMRVSEAESWVSEAVGFTAMNFSSIAAVGCYEKAIQVYRSVPRTERGVFRVEDRIKEIRTFLADAGNNALGEMVTIRTPVQDVSGLAEAARQAVSGKDPINALKVFANLIPAPTMKERREQAKKHFRDFPMQALFGCTLMSRDGRVIAKRPSVDFLAELSDNDESVRARMIEDYKFWINLVVRAEIMPALWTLIPEHRLRETDFMSLAAESPVVPIGRARLVGKALYAGYELNFDIALHLLIPQIEHIVRECLKGAGTSVTTLDLNGIETVVGFSTLMDRPEADKIFGEDFAFELRALFCDAYGPNLRNELAHGLLDDSDSQSVYAIYAWWLGLKLILNTYLKRLENENQISDSLAGEDGSGEATSEMC